MKVLKGLIAALMLSQSMEAAVVGGIDFSGSFLSVVDLFQQSTLRNAQFDQGLNLNLSVTVNSQVMLVAQLQGGPGGGFIGFAGPGVSVSQMYVAYAPNEVETWTLGTFAQPLGQSASRLSANADGGNNSFLVNTLGYAALSTAVGNLNTTGLGWQRNVDIWTWTLALSNGVGATAANTAGTFEGLIGLQVQPGNGPWVFSATYMQSDDSTNAPPNLGNNFNLWMVDVSFQQDGNPWTGIAYVGQFFYQDGNSALSDGVGVASGELAYYFTPEFYLAARWSVWVPQDSDGNGSGISAMVPNPGYGVNHGGYVVATDQRLDRYQVGLGAYLSDAILTKAEYLLDNYTHGEDVVAVIGSVNFFF